MKFTTAISENWLLQKLPWTDLWTVFNSFKWEVVYWDRNTIITVPYGTVTDFGSIPFFLRAFINPTKYISYILHDYLYENDFLINWKILSRKDKDLILFEALWVEWAFLFTRVLIYLWVRIWGGLFYNK